MIQDDRLGPYRLLRRLGEGGMGVVHLALDPHGRQVAVKVLRPEVTQDDLARRRLSREVETMRRVRSPHIAEVLDADVTGRRPYIVTRYVPGRPLDEVVKQDGPLPVDALLLVGAGVAEALAAVHAAGVIHRDLKPGNVLMLDGRPVLIDFGIAQGVDATRLTQTGMFIGTPGYLAPEIIEGHEAGPKVDVHAWGGTLLYAATGLPPFGKGTLEMIFYNITSGKANVSAAPALVQPVLRAALQRDPARRPTAAELSRQVTQLMQRAGRVRVPDEITTVPNVDETTGRPVPVAGAAGPPAETQLENPVVTRPAPPANPMATQAAPPANPGQPVPAQPPAEEFVSLLDQGASPGGAGDPFPTVRVTGDDLRRAGLSGTGATSATGADDAPTRYAPPTGAAASAPTTGPRASSPTPAVTPPSVTTPPSATPHAVPPSTTPPPVAANPASPAAPPSGTPWAPATGETDVPTRRVRPEELRGAYGPHALFEQAPEIYEQTPQVGQPHPAPFQPTMRVPPPPVAASGSAPATPLQRSKAYGVAAAMLLLLVVALTVIAPLLVMVIALPITILLRAADIAQPELNARRAPAAAATDVVRVLGRPDALIKSVGITIALVPYALILGLPVTLLLTVLVTKMSTLDALSWGIAVALWTVCAGPGVEGPSRQMRRTIASLLPTRSSAAALAWGAGAVAAVVTAIALTGLMGKQTGGHFMGPVNVPSVVQDLNQLRNKAGNQ
ncbi:serine/threonine-protein kinase [Microtetraspora fusca]|uniref:serine/threonine-protein kinase n=1 Tax=Microtetraspora fusca TaxID=1997 RepID=UPI000829BBCA|nr:serine/threonine-protein kinase [Microtetraspora fusca]